MPSLSSPSFVLPTGSGHVDYSVGGTTNDLSGLTFRAGVSTVLRMTNTVDATLNGIAGGVDGALLTVIRVGTANVILASQSTASIAANGFVTIGSVNTPIPSGGSALCVYDGATTRWRLLTMQQPWTEYDNGNTGAALAVNWSANGPLQKCTRNASCTLTLTAPPTAQTLIMKFVHEASATAYTVAFSPAVKNPAGTGFVFTNTSGAIDIVTFYWDGTNYYVSGQANYA